MHILAIKWLETLCFGSCRKHKMDPCHNKFKMLTEKKLITLRRKKKIQYFQKEVQPIYKKESGVG